MTITVTEKQCSICKQVKLADHFSLDKWTKSGLYSACKPCYNFIHGSKRSERSRTNIQYAQKQSFNRKKSRAKRDGTEFTLQFSDIQFPTHCPYLGIELNYLHDGSGLQPNSPSYDRINPELGYIPGNVQIVSHMYNCLKQQLTDTEVKQILKSSPLIKQIISEINNDN